MTWRRVVEEYEADLYKVPKPRFFRTEMGELERKTYADGEQNLDIRFRGVEVPDGESVAVVISGRSVCEIEVRSGRGRRELSSNNGDSVPTVQAGEVAEIQYAGQTLLRGTFLPD